MVVRFHLEDHCQCATDVDGPGVFAWTLQDAPAAGRQELEELARVLVAAVLAPHRAEHAELDAVWLPTQARHDLLIFGRQQADGAQRWSLDRGRHPEATLSA